MPAILLKRIDQLDDAEQEALAAALGTPEWYTDVFDVHVAAGLAVRAAVEAGEWHFEYSDVVAVLNMHEVSNQLSHQLYALMTQNAKKMHVHLCSARCSYCGWLYRDESIDWPYDREVADEDLRAIEDRISAQVREHMGTCPEHPMRAMERELAELRADEAAR